MSIADKLRDLADEIDDGNGEGSDAAWCLELIQNFNRYDGTYLRVRQLDWEGADGTSIVIKCDPPVLVCVYALSEIQVLEAEGCAICRWLVRLAEARTDVRNVSSLSVPGLGSDEDVDTHADFWTATENVSGETQEIVNGSPLTATSRWACDNPDDYDDDAVWLKGEDLTQMGEFVDYITMNLGNLNAGG
jgi:hypothetical protein